MKNTSSRFSLNNLFKRQEMTKVIPSAFHNMLITDRLIHMSMFIGVVLFCVTFDGKIETLVIRLGIIEIFMIGLPLMVFAVIILSKRITPNLYWKGDCVYQFEFKGNIDEITITLCRMGLKLSKKNENLYFFSLEFLKVKNDFLLIKDCERHCVLICSDRYREVLIKHLELEEVEPLSKGLLKNLN